MLNCILLKLFYSGKKPAHSAQLRQNEKLELMFTGSKIVQFGWYDSVMFSEFSTRIIQLTFPSKILPEGTSYRNTANTGRC